MSLSFPTLPEQPGLTVRYSALLYTLIHLLLEIGNRGPGLGPQDKVPRFISLRPAIPLGWKLCCKQEDRRRIHTQGIQMGARAGTQDNFTAIYN